LSEIDKENNKKPGGLETIIALPAKYIMSVIGVALSISGFVALVTTQSVRAWVKNHPYPIYLALIVALLVVAGTLDYAYNMRKRIRLPSDHDRKLCATTLERLPVNGPVIAWLKHTKVTEASVSDFPADVLGALEKTIEFSRTLPVGFDDAQLARSFESLIKASTSFCHSVDSWTFAAHSQRLKKIMAPPPGDASMEEGTTALTHRQHELVKAYDHFIRTAHARGIDIDG
jgi:hypothetical protein